MEYKDIDNTNEDEADLQEFMEELKELMGDEESSTPSDASNLEMEALMKKGDKKIVYNSGHYAFTYQTIVDQLPAGYYQPGETRDGIFILSDLNKTKLNSQSIRIQDLVLSNMNSKSSKQRHVASSEYFPMEQYSEELMSIKSNIEAFLNKKSFYTDRNLDYKRAFLLYGEPGTGKSRFVEHMTDRLVREQDAVVIRIESTNQLDHVVDKGILCFNDYLKGRLKVFVIEELTNLVRHSGSYAELLNFLDSPHLRNDVIFFITTNYPDKIPNNIIDRPSRLDVLAGLFSKEYNTSFLENWYQFLLKKPFPNEERFKEWYKHAISELTPAYLKELFLLSELQDISLEDAWKSMNGRKKLIKNGFNRKSSDSVGF